jgi:hypothetical protein
MTLWCRDRGDRGITPAQARAMSRYSDQLGHVFNDPHSPAILALGSPGMARPIEAVGVDASIGLLWKRVARSITTTGPR